MSQPCPCGGGATYADCCGRYHAGLTAPSAAALMRSRYTAFARGDAGYLLQTWHPSTRPAQLDLAGDGTVWRQLEILRRDQGAADAAEGRVEFKAHWQAAGRSGCLHETSRFLKEDGRWYYLNGDVHPSAAAKVGRNDPCPCGSGKKYKRCCGC